MALDDAAAARLRAEAQVLDGLDSPRLVRLLEPPAEIGGRTVLLLESAGDETLAEVLRGRARLSLDLLERWGTELLQALVALESMASTTVTSSRPTSASASRRGDRRKHLVLFDFSLARAGATAVTAGYPALPRPVPGAARRGRYDSAAERYAAAVVLFEMATGAAPEYGDGDPTRCP